MRAATCLFAGAVLLLAFAPSAAVDKSRDRSGRTSDRFSVDAAVVPYTQVRVHRVGKIRFSVSNWGFIGSQAESEYEQCADRRAPSFEYPKRSGINYLFQGALWIGAVKGGDTLVSVGVDGWNFTHELFPASFPEGQIIERTTRPILRPEQNSACPDVFFSPDAISEQDLLAVYSDTIPDPNGAGLDGPHIPLEVQVTQASYSWSYDYADEFIIVDWTVENAGSAYLNDVRLGLLVDADVGHLNTGAVYEDDICGFLRTVPSLVGLLEGDSLNLAWAADNDGDPNGGGGFDNQSPTAALGVRLLRTPTGAGPASFNWWASNSSPYLDWGPNKRTSQVIYVAGNLGTPEGDKTKYQSLSNGEFDYDQIETALDHQSDGWLPPPASASVTADIADGRDIFMLLGTEQFDLAPGQSVPLTVALIAGPQFHVDPATFVSYFDPYAPDQFKARLDFDGLVRNARWAGWLFDNPGRDTDGDGNRGQYVIEGDDTLYYTGDGVPDYRGPQGPPAPEMQFETSPGRITLRWNGYQTERARDPFTHVRDFEGYRVYMGRSSARTDFALVAQRDRIDFLRREYEPIGDRWLVREPVFTLDTLKTLYDSLVLATRGYPFDPDSFRDTSFAGALMAVTVDTVDPGLLDTNYYAFSPFDLNYQVDDAAVYYADSAGLNVVRVIRKPYPFAAPLDTMLDDDGTPFLPYYEYEYVIDGLYIGDPVWMAVTAFDFGDPPSGAGSTEGDFYGNAQEIWPLATGATADSARPAPGVYPNPYRMVDDYVGRGWERLNPGLPNPEYSRQMTFYNLPDTCTISIWTLDGDLVRELRHRAGPGDPQASFAIWDLINRNNDVITYGLYIYSIESSSGTFVGKLAIIR